MQAQNISQQASSGHRINTEDIVPTPHLVEQVDSPDGESSASSSLDDHLFPGVPYEPSLSASGREAFPSLSEDLFPGVPTPDDEPLPPNNSELPISASYHSVPYELSADKNENQDDNIAQNAIPADELFHASFQDIPYESSNGNSNSASNSPQRRSIRDPSMPGIAEGSLPGIPYEQEAPHGASENSTEGYSYPGVPYTTYPGTQQQQKEAFPDTDPSDLFPGVPPCEPYESDSNPPPLRGNNNFREAFPSLPSDTFPGVPEYEDPSESESSHHPAQDHSIIQQPQTENNTSTTTTTSTTQEEQPTIKVRSNSKRVQEIFSEIDNIDIDKIQLRPDTVKYLETLSGYLQCFERLQVVYAEVDQDGVLASHTIPDIIIQQPSSSSSSSSSMMPPPPPPQQSKHGKQVRNIVELYDAAALVLPVFISKVRGLVASVRRELQSDDIHFVLPPGENKLKGRRRAQEKAEKYTPCRTNKNRWGAPESWLYDIVRGSVVFRDASQLLHFLERLQADKSIQIVKSKNRFQNPTLSGYRDWMLQIQFSAVVHSRNHRLESYDGRTVPHICELQLHHQAIKEADTQLGSHRYYEFLREYYDGSTGSLEDRLEDLRMISDGNNNDSSLNLTFLKAVIQNPVGIERMNRLTTLFADHVNDYRLAMVIANATRSIDDDETNKKEEVYTMLGNILKKQGRLADAMEMYQQDLDIRLETLGNKDHDDDDDEDIQWAAYNNIATVLSGQGRYEEAMDMYQKSLDMKLKVLGRDHADTANTYHGMAMVLGRQGKYEESMDMHKEALDIQIQVLGQDNPDTATSYFGLASILQQQNAKSKRALKIYDTALKIRLKTLGRDHPEVATVYFKIGTILLEQHRYKEAKGTFQQAIDIRIRTLGRSHSLTSQAYHSLSKTHYNMALVYSTNQNRLEDALGLFRQALEIQKTIRGPTHPATGRIYKTMGRILEKQCKREEAKKMFQLARKCK